MQANSEKERLLKRFWDKVLIPENKEDCWEWQAQVNRYGKFRYPTGQLAHRFSWEIHNGEIPPGIHVLHKCDNTKCVNPRHLFLGTHDDNMKDRKTKGRYKQPQGEGHPMSRFKWEDINYIRSTSKPSKDLAKEFNTTYHYINEIRRGDVWK